MTSVLLRSQAPILTAMAAALVGVLLVDHGPPALALAAVPLLLLLLVRPVVAAVAGVALIPWVVSLPGLPLQIDASDVLMLMALVAILLAAAGELAIPSMAAVRPVMPYIYAYGAALAVVTLAHPDSKALINSAQRFQIVIVPLLLGAVVLSRFMLRRALALYIWSAVLLGVTTELGLIPDSFGFQKNPVGQFLAGALIVSLGSSVGGRMRFVAMPLLALALVRTESRGAVLGLLVGIAVLVLARPGLSRVRLAGYLVPVVIVLGFAFVSLPDDVRQRATTFSASNPGGSLEGASTIKLREEYRRDAEAIIKAQPVFGVGVGNYYAGSLEAGTLTRDPHNVLLLETAEGGFVLLGGLALLVLGSGAVLIRRRTVSELAPLALALQASLLAHGLVDVYWVRGTPVLGWLVVGAALREAYREAP